jgi:hypothetical protein
MTDAEIAQTGSRSKSTLIIGSGLAALVLLAVVGFLVYSSVCPCDRTPGGFLFGDRVEEPVQDWNFANDIPLCQLQIYDGIRPHSINLNCMSTPAGELYLSCSVCTQKYWAGKVGPNETAVMRLNGTTYPVTLNRVQNPAEMDRAWQARVNKLQVHGGGPYNPTPDPDAERPGHWWTFHVESRS